MKSSKWQSDSCLLSGSTSLVFIGQSSQFRLCLVPDFAFDDMTIGLLRRG